jgi:uncharacterized Zn finger protein (UPF0148 family)
MDVSGTQNLTSNIQQYMSVMKQRIDSAINDAVSVANVENGNPLGDSFEFSGPADLLSKLSQLQETDPEKFKELCSDIAEKLRDAAQSAGEDGTDVGMLESLASKFETAASTGDLSSLQPPKMGQGGGGPQGAGGAPPAGASGAAGGAGGVSSAEECSTCPVCSAKIEDGASVCSKCGSQVNEDDSEEETTTSDAASQNAKIAQYLLYSTEREQNSLLETLTKMWDEKGSDSNSGSDTMSEIRTMLTQAFERITQ